jgi:hypothetical protein
MRISELRFSLGRSSHITNTEVLTTRRVVSLATAPGVLFLRKGIFYETSILS